MFNQHFVKTLVRFIFMILAGVIILFGVNYFFPESTVGGTNSGTIRD